MFVGSAGNVTTFVANIPENLHAFLRVRARNACGSSLVFDEVELGALWSVGFRPGLNVDSCAPGIPGGFCSQVVVARAPPGRFARRGVKYVGTATLGGSSTPVRVYPGNDDPECRLP